MSVPLGAFLYLASTLLFWKTPSPPPLDRDHAKTAFTGPSWEFTNPEADQLITELKAEKGALALRTQQLDELAARLNAERLELAAATQTVRQLQDEFDKSVVAVQDQEVPNLKKLAKVYAAMSSEGAARILREMEDEQVVKILALMKESESAPILENLGQGTKDEPKRAALLSNRLRLIVASGSSRKTSVP